MTPVNRLPGAVGAELATGLVAVPRTVARATGAQVIPPGAGNASRLTVSDFSAFKGQLAVTQASCLLTGIRASSGDYG